MSGNRYEVGVQEEKLVSGDGTDGVVIKLPFTVRPLVADATPGVTVHRLRVEISDSVSGPRDLSREQARGVAVVHGVRYFASVVRDREPEAQERLIVTRAMLDEYPVDPARIPNHVGTTFEVER